MANLTRYTMVVRRDENGFATPALKVRRKGEVVKFAEIEDLLRTSGNTGSPKPAPEIVESSSLCDYCQYGHNEDPGVCGACDDYNCFRGRRLRAGA